MKWFHVGCLILAVALSPLHAAEKEPEILKALPNVPHLKATLHCADGTIVQDVAILRWGNEQDPRNTIIRFHKSPFKSAISIDKVAAIEFDQQPQEEGPTGLVPGAPIKLTLTNGKTETVKYIDGLNDSMKIVYYDNFAETYLQLYVDLFEPVPDDPTRKQPKIFRIDTAAQAMRRPAPAPTAPAVPKTVRRTVVVPTPAVPQPTRGKISPMPPPPPAPPRR